MHVFDHVCAEGVVFCTNLFEYCGVIETTARVVMKISTGFPKQESIVLGVWLHSEAVITGRLELPWVLAVMVGIPVERVRPRASSVLSIELAPYCPSLNKFL